MIIHDADQHGAVPALPAPRPRRTFQPDFVCVSDVSARQDAAKKWRRSVCRRSGNLRSWAAAIKIAMRDLEIRGAGNLLGAEQHGHMEAVGYDLYCKLLNEAVLALRGDGTKPRISRRWWTATSTRIFRPSYIRNEYQKLDVYKRISGIENRGRVHGYAG